MDGGRREEGMWDERGGVNILNRKGSSYWNDHHTSRSLIVVAFELSSHVAEVSILHRTFQPSRTLSADNHQFIS